MIDALGIGVCTLDVLVIVESFPKDEGVQLSRGATTQGGGPVATAMAALAKLSGRAVMLDRLGDDWRGDWIVRDLQAVGVDTQPMLFAQGHSSALSSILVRRSDGARAIIYDPGSAPELTGSDIPWELVQQARIVHMNGRHLEACLALTDFAKLHDVLLCFDGGANRYRSELDPLLSRVDVCIAAQEFATAYTGCATAEQSARAMRNRGIPLVGVTCGAAGSWLASDSEFFHQAAYAVEDVVDSTGAGDAYHGAFLYGLSRGWPLRKTASLASAVGALNTTKLGGRAALPSLADASRLVTAGRLLRG